MDPLTALAASGLRSRTETLDLLANNIANAGTAGYKADGAAYNLYFGDSAWDGVSENRPAGNEMPLVQRNWTDFGNGNLMETGNLSDIAISSPGFFVVQTTSGPLYTRSGRFRVSKSGTLETKEGYPVLGTNNKPIQLDPNAKFIVSAAGQVSQNGSEVGSLKIENVQTVDALIKRGSTYFSLIPGATTTAVPNPEVQQGKIEASNVEPTQATVKLVGVLRQFEMLQRAVRLAGDMQKQAVEQVAKIGS